MKKIVREEEDLLLFSIITIEIRRTKMIKVCEVDPTDITMLENENEEKRSLKDFLRDLWRGRFDK